MMKKALICIDRHEAKCSAQLLEIIGRIYDENRVETYAVWFEHAPEIESGLFHQVHWFHADDNQYYDVRWLASCIRTLHDTEQFDCIIVPATGWGRMLAPVLAMKLRTGLVADVTDVSETDGIIQMIRPAFEGKLMAKIINQEASPVLMSVRLGVFQYQGKIIRETQIFTHDQVSVCKAGIRLIAQEEAGTSQDIRDARILVSGGGGIADHFPELQKFAKLLNAMPSSSRRLVDEGITKRVIQVGQSGKIVSPNLYIALGIYGSMQHMEGLKGVNDIISVNTNKNAPICSLSTIVVEGDAVEFIKKLSKKIKKESKEVIIMNIKDFKMDYFSLKGKNAIVTGGNTGLGQAFSLALAKAGANIFMPSIMPDDPEFNALIEAEGGKAIYMVADITEEKMPEKIVKTCMEELGTVDILVNCAGICLCEEVTKFGRELWDKMVNINLTAAFEMSHECAKVMIPQKSGKIINICSLFSFLGCQLSPAYVATKHGIAGLTKAYSDELGQYNVQVNGIAPGYFKTKAAEYSINDPERNKWIVDHTPANRWGEVHDLMGATVFLASDASQFVSGHILAVDGGFLIR